MKKTASRKPLPLVGPISSFLPQVDGEKGYVGCLQNVTAFEEERKAHETEVQRWNALVEQMPVGVYVLDVSEGFRYLQANAAYARMHDRATGDFVGRTLREVLPPDLAEEAVEQAEQVVAKGGGQVEFRHDFYDGSGSLHVTKHTAQYYVDPSGRRLILGTERDVTEADYLHRFEAVNAEIMRGSYSYKRLDDLIEASAQALIRTFHCSGVRWTTPDGRLTRLHFPGPGSAQPPDWPQELIDLLVATADVYIARDGMALLEDLSVIPAFAEVLKTYPNFPRALGIFPAELEGRRLGALVMEYPIARSFPTEIKSQMRMLRDTFVAIARRLQAQRLNELLVDSAPNPVAILDNDGRTLRSNALYTNEIGPLVAEKRPEDAPPLPRHVVRDGAPKGSLRWEHGGHIWQIEAHGIYDEMGTLNYIHTSAIDVGESERKMSRQLAIASCMKTLLADEEDLMATTARVIETVVEYFHAYGGNFMQFTAEEMKLLGIAGFADCAPSELDTIRVKVKMTPFWQKFCDGFKTHEVVEFLDYQNNHSVDMGEWDDFIRAHGVGSLYISRLQLRGVAWGDFALYFKDANRVLTEDEREMLGNFRHVIEMLLLKNDFIKNLRNERDRAVEAERAKSFFFSCVSHDLRTPLNSVIGFTELLKEGEVDPKKRAEYLDNIVFSGQTLMSLVNDVLDFGALDAGKVVYNYKLEDVRSLATKVLNVTEGGSVKDLAFKLEAPDNLPLVKVDRKRITQVLFNLVSNAAKFTEHGGVTVRIGFSHDDGGRGTLRFDVIDTGVGIAASDIPKVMQPFVRIENKTQTGGTGLGLPICNLLVKQMGGAISITSELDKGSTFTVAFPNVEFEEVKVEELEVESSRLKVESSALQPSTTSPKTPTTTTSNVQPSTFNSQLRILLVDDAPMNLKVLSAYCKKLGVKQVVTADSGAEALVKLQTQTFDAVLTDVWMPGMSGEQLVAKIRENPDWAAMPVYAITADVEMKKRAKETPFTGVVFKPIRIAMIQALLAKIVPAGARQ